MMRGWHTGFSTPPAWVTAVSFVRPCNSRMKGSVMLNTKKTLIALFSAAVLTACGGGGGDGDGSDIAQSANNSNQPPAPYADANCPSGVPEVWSYSSSRNLKLIYGSNVFEIELPSDSSAINFNACILTSKFDIGEFNVPTDVLNLLPPGQSIYVHLKTAGTIDALISRKLTIEASTPFGSYLEKTIFSHTQDGNGAWVRKQLDTIAQDAGSRTLYTTDIVASGYYSVE